MKRGAEDTDISVVEGVMGYYDGLGGIDTKASAYDLAAVTGYAGSARRGYPWHEPFCRLRRSKAFSTYKKEQPYRRGDLQPDVPHALSGDKKADRGGAWYAACFGYVPEIKELNLESRHLGLVLPDEVKELSEEIRSSGGNSGKDLWTSMA